MSKASKRWLELTKTLQLQPKTTSPVEMMYALMKEAESCTPGTDEQKFRAMDLHNALMDFSQEGGSFAQEVLRMSILERITRNQERMGIS